MISAVEPGFYAKRFLKFMAKQVFINENKDFIFNKHRKKKEIQRMWEDFGDKYHKMFACQHCGNTYNDASDKRVTTVFRHIEKVRNEPVC